MPNPDQTSPWLARSSSMTSQTSKPFSTEALCGLIEEVLRWSDEELTAHRELATEDRESG